jgi:hypothetical protein
VDVGDRKRFSDDDGSQFDIAAYGRDSDKSAPDAESASDGEPHLTDTVPTEMTDESETGDDEKSLAEQNAEQIADLSETVKDFIDAEASDDEADAEKSTDGDEADEPTQAEKNAEAISELAETVETLTDATGVSQQADTSTKADGDASTWGNSPFSPRGN